MIWEILWKCDQDQIWFDWKRKRRGIGGCWWFLTGDLKNGIIFNIIDQVIRWYGRYPESLMKIRHDKLTKSYSPGGVGGWGWGLGLVLVKFEEWSKPFNISQIDYNSRPKGGTWLLDAKVGIVTLPLSHLFKYVWCKKLSLLLISNIELHLPNEIHQTIQKRHWVHSPLMIDSLVGLFVDLAEMTSQK